MASSPPTSTGPGLNLINSKDITLGKILGRGGFGAVYKAKHVNWGDVAVKRLKGITLTADVQKEAERMLRVISSPYIVRVMGLFKTPRDMGIVMEFFKNGSLKDFEKKYMKCECWARKVKMVQDIAYGMNYLHTLDPPILHCDLKLENVFVDNAFDAKIGDLGLAVSSKASIQEAHNSGTRSHMPPEAYDPATAPTEFSDIYTFAITLYELVSGNDAWPQQRQFANDTLIDYWVKTGHRPELGSIPAEAPQELTKVITKCWVEEPKNRPSFKDILDSVTQLFETKYKRGLRKADMEINKQFEHLDSHEEEAPHDESSTSDSGVDFWGSLETIHVSRTEAKQDEDKKDDNDVDTRGGGDNETEEQDNTTEENKEEDRGKDKDKEEAKEGQIRKNLKWQQKYTIDPGCDFKACHMIRHNQLAICGQGCVMVYEEKAESFDRQYEVTHDDWKGKYIWSVAVSESVPNNILVTCENSPFVYVLGLSGSKEMPKKFKIQCDKKELWFLIANVGFAVIGMDDLQSVILCRLPYFKDQTRVEIGFDLVDMKMSSDYLLIADEKKMTMRALTDVNQNVCTIESPDGWTIKSISLSNNASEIHACCARPPKHSVYKYLWDGVDKRYVNSGCAIDDVKLVKYRRLSVTSSPEGGLLAAGRWFTKDVKIYTLK